MNPTARQTQTISHPDRDAGLAGVGSASGGAGDLTLKDRLHRITRRQMARFLDHLRDKGRITPELEADVVRMFRYLFNDLHHELDAEEQNHEHVRS